MSDHHDQDGDTRMRATPGFVVRSDGPVLDGDHFHVNQDGNEQPADEQQPRYYPQGPLPRQVQPQEQTNAARQDPFQQAGAMPPPLLRAPHQQQWHQQQWHQQQWHQQHQQPWQPNQPHMQPNQPQGAAMHAPAAFFGAAYQPGAYMPAQGFVQPFAPGPPMSPIYLPTLNLPFPGPAQPFHPQQRPYYVSPNGPISTQQQQQQQQQRRQDHRRRQVLQLQEYQRQREQLQQQQRQQRQQRSAPQRQRQREQEQRVLGSLFHFDDGPGDVIPDQMDDLFRSAFEADLWDAADDMMVYFQGHSGPFASVTRTGPCPICQTEMTQEDPLLRAGVESGGEHYRKHVCEHFACRSCWQSWIKAKVEDGDRQIRCFGESCKYTLFPDDVERLAARDVFETYDKRRQEDYTERSQELKRLAGIASAARVGVAQQQSEEPPSSSAAPASSAGSSTTAQAEQAESSTHPATKDEDAKSAKYILDSSVECPKCHIMVYKDGGCSTVKCTCGHSFTWHSTEQEDYYRVMLEGSVRRLGRLRHLRRGARDPSRARRGQQQVPQLDEFVEDTSPNAIAGSLQPQLFGAPLNVGHNATFSATSNRNVQAQPQTDAVSRTSHQPRWRSARVSSMRMNRPVASPSAGPDGGSYARSRQPSRSVRRQAAGWQPSVRQSAIHTHVRPQASEVRNVLTVLSDQIRQNAVWRSRTVFVHVSPDGQWRNDGELAALV